MTRTVYPRGCCLFCCAWTLIETDARLPLLRVVACRPCRDYIAALCGWGRHRFGSRTWRRDGQVEFA